MTANRTHDLVIVGGGPAGLSAASVGSELGLKTLVLDEQASPGGQIYRNIERVSPEVRRDLGSDYAQGLTLVETFRKSGAEYQEKAVVWNVEHNGNVYYSLNGKSSQIAAKKVIIAIGATERAVPFSGWNLPGVMGVGAIDAHFKSSGSLPAGPVVLCGSGPLLLLIVGHLTHFGVEIQAVLDTTPSGNILPALSSLPGALKRYDYLLKGVGMLANIAKKRITYYRQVQGYKALGADRVEEVCFTVNDKEHRLPTEMLLVHEGVVSRCDFSMLLGLKHGWDPIQRYWYPETNDRGATASENIYIAGDGAYVHGGVAAAVKGALAAQEIAKDLGLLSPGEMSDATPRLEKELLRELAPRPFIDKLYSPRKNLYSIDDDTLVCRCEEVRAGSIRQAIKEGCREPNEIKSLTRCGMGPCQGRMCGAALAEIVAESQGLQPDELRPLNIRAPVRNLSLVELSEVDLLERAES